MAAYRADGECSAGDDEPSSVNEFARRGDAKLRAPGGARPIAAAAAAAAAAADGRPPETSKPVVESE